MKEESFLANEIPPSFRGGDEALKEFIKSNLVYPEESKISGISGTVMVEFLVDTDGSIKDIQILYSLDRFTDMEVIRVVKLMNGLWKPGERDDKKVAMRVFVSSFQF
jgi:protein TonB